MASHQEDIASKLLQSSDARIAEAAKRVFSSYSLPAAASSLAALSAASSSAVSAASSSAGGAYYDESAAYANGADQCDINGVGLGVLLYGGAQQHSTDNTTSNDDFQDENEGDDKKPSSTERLKRSRERNRMHARKTRQRKKEHMQKLQNRADELKLEQIRLKQAINEKNTASILVGLFQNGEDGSTDGNSSNPLAIDPNVEVLLKRSTEDIPDASKIPELPALILPGQHNGKRKSTDGEGDGEKEGSSNLPDEVKEDGIDYRLLGKDRSACTPAELDQIRRERNRMHAKRTRDRKRIFMEEMEVMIKQLEDENALLQAHATKLNAHVPPAEEADESAYFPQAITPEFAPVPAPSTFGLTASTGSHLKSCDGDEPKGDFLNQIESLLAAAGSFQKKGSECEINAISCAESDVTASTNHSDHNSFGEDEEYHHLLGSHPSKRQRMDSVPKSITTMNYSTM